MPAYERAPPATPAPWVNPCSHAWAGARPSRQQELEGLLPAASLSSLQWLMRREGCQSPRVLRRLEVPFSALISALLAEIGLARCGECRHYSTQKERRIVTYIHEQKGWPRFQWAEEQLLQPLAAVRHRQGRLVGHMQGLGFSLRSEAVLQTLTQDVLKSSEIEGEVLDQQQVRSSLARRLGIEISALAQADRHVDGVVEMMLDATQNYDQPLTADRLFGWHAGLFPTGLSGTRKIRIGNWRNDKDGPMQVVSGYPGRERVHYEAPNARKVARQMGIFLKWFNGDASVDPVLKAGIAHLWFVTIHPFEDGNGRVARAISDMALAQSEQSPQRFYSMSAQIRLERKTYYDMLETTQKGDLNITAWLQWFLSCLDRAFAQASSMLANVLAKSRFWQTHTGATFNARQCDMINRLLEGFEGKLTSTKWAKIEKCSQDTAHRDIADLINRGVLAQDAAGGRSTSYSLVIAKNAQPAIAPI
jgi:Fic family protein